MSNILVIDTSTEACSVALQVGDTVYSDYKVAPRQHGELVLPMVDSLLEKAQIKLPDLDVIGYGQGPGAFTGLRICISIVQGLAYGAGVPVVGVSSLQAMAQATYQSTGEKHILSAIDARMGEVYWGVYQLKDGLMTLVGEEEVAEPESVTIDHLDSSIVYRAVGSGWQTYPDELAQRCNVSLVIEEEVSFPSAESMLPWVSAQLMKGLAVDAEQAQPVYLRNNVAKKVAEQGKAG
ncbi:tRNA (adenosine(37)-N6)-threonylcarbamoyltransferase complex dimerization subunit type 1 TsaB [Kangiella sp.]|uniref:tRNA (adenosine(37)-N6)-threonylcarbamoyltransferase complex dimerization subunit type 1 TsaB n=1 Tax=Kangiella sp. TaxID=1920245 RepID=UPI0019C2B19A|nr:tRNA (adenosine(37)-N6)-threonylcarbamoyltransferase complex dimerization subunit type 1 TsaB [Kangiella sp.]MBD3653606.1 tRNA (adenosine(37)-N6)-threonylcarbamoyltransferase complex dimerization subunit type 1 TsaB [Kangiella sp.]